MNYVNDTGAKVPVQSQQEIQWSNVYVSCSSIVIIDFEKVFA